MSDLDLDELRAELDDFAAPEKKGGRSAREERIVAGFEEIQRFVETHGRPPMHGEGRDIFERLYAVRLDRLRGLEESRTLLAPLDHQGLLGGATAVAAAPVEVMGDDELLAELEGAAGASDITELRHVRTSAEKRAAEEIANRERCEDFDRFKPLFTAVQNDLDSGMRITQPIRKDAGFLKTDIRAGEFFILGGQVAYVAEVGEPFKAPNGESDARLRVIYSNGTESNLLLRSLQRALYKDEVSRRVSEPSAGPLFASESLTMSGQLNVRFLKVRQSQQLARSGCRLGGAATVGDGRSDWGAPLLATILRLRLQKRPGRLIQMPSAHLPWP